MDSVKNFIRSLSFIKYLHEKTQLQPELLFGVVLLFTIFIITKTSLGPLVSNLITLFIPIKESLIILKSRNPKIEDYRKVVIALTLFSIIFLLELLGFSTIFPFFSFIKIVLIIWTSILNSHAEFIYDTFLSKIPIEYVHFADGIETAVKKAAKAVEDKAVKGGNIEISTSKLN